MPEQPTVFILDDDDAVRDSLQILLGSAGYPTESFPSALDFLKSFDDRRPGCLIADVRMPGMTGLELQEQLRERRVPLSIIIMTGHGDITMAIRALRAGAIDFIEKPFTDHEILDAVQRATELVNGVRRDGAGDADAALTQDRIRLLSAPEKAVLREIMGGRSTAAAAALLSMPAKAVELHRAHIMEKLGAESTAELIRLAWTGSASAMGLRFQLDDEGAPEALLRGAVEAALTIVGARFSAAAVLESDRPDIQWFAAGGVAPTVAVLPSGGGKSLLACVATERRPKRLIGLPGDPRVVGLPESFPNIHTMLAVPLATRRRVFGWLALFDKIGADGFSDDDEQIALTVASQLAHGLQLGMLNRELGTRVEQQRAVARIAALALGAVGLQALLDEAVAVVARTMEVECCSILQLGSAKESMTVRAGVGWPKDVIGSEIAIDYRDDLVGHALASTEPIVFANLSAEIRFRAAPFMYQAGVVSGLTTAVPGMAQPYGTLGAHSLKPRRFTDDEIGFVKTVANLLGQAVIRHQTEGSLRRAQKMEAIGLLTGGIAHDFNNLLTVILGNAQLAASMIEGSADLQEINAEIEAAARRGADLTQRLLAFSRRQTLKPDAIDVAALVFGMRALLARTLGTSIEIDVLSDPEAAPAYADAAQLENALLNLSINARDAMPDGGKLIIEVRNADIDEAYAASDMELKAGSYVVLAVSDTGIGMAPDIVNRAFEPFFTTKTVGKGSGLGLSMVYGFARQSGGCVKLYSEPGRGTTVRLYLPRAADADARAVQREGDAASDTIPRGREAILVVEDDKQVSRYVVRQLRLLGYQVLHAADGPSALEIVRSSAVIDLLFADVVMPGGMNGLEVAAAAREIRNGLRVLFASGYPEAVLSTRAAPVEFAMLQKPYQVAELAHALRRAFGADAAAAR